MTLSWLVQHGLPFVFSAITIWSIFLAGDKNPSAWLVSLANQGLWLVWIVAVGAWGLLPLNFAMWWVSYRNWSKWTVNERTRPDRANTSCTDR